jgi:hypothetical protein
LPKHRKPEQPDHELCHHPVPSHTTAGPNSLLTEDHELCHHPVPSHTTAGPNSLLTEDHEPCHHPVPSHTTAGPNSLLTEDQWYDALEDGLGLEEPLADAEEEEEEEEVPAAAAANSAPTPAPEKHRFSPQVETQVQEFLALPISENPADSGWQQVSNDKGITARRPLHPPLATTMAVLLGWSKVSPPQFIQRYVTGRMVRVLLGWL